MDSLRRTIDTRLPIQLVYGDNIPDAPSPCQEADALRSVQRAEGVVLAG